MIKKLLISLGVISILAGALFIFSSIKKNENRNIYKETIDISKEYLKLRYQTDLVLTEANKFSFNDWNKQVDAINKGWQELEKESAKLEVEANNFANEKTTFKFFSETLAYDKQEISDIFDKAPAGKKIATLAKHLGVDAKLAFKILQQDQNQVTADAWNEAGDTLQNLETSATVIKDGCKVAGFVGGIVISGGTSAIAAGSTLAKATVIITGADLTLEVSEDAATIALGNHNKVSAIINDARKITEPIATLLNINEIPNNLKTGLDKFDAAMIAIDQFRGVIQDEKIIGITLPVYTKDKTKPPVKVAVLKKDEVDTWLNDNGINPEIENKKTVEEILGISQPKYIATPSTTPNNQVTTPTEAVETVNDSSIGKWTGTLHNTAGGGGEVFYYNWVINLDKDGSVSFSSGGGEFEFLSWKQVGENIRLFGEDPSAGYYEFNHQGNSLVLTKTVIFGTEYLAGGPGIMGGKEIEGTLVKQ